MQVAGTGGKVQGTTSTGRCHTTAARKFACRLVTHSGKTPARVDLAATYAENLSEMPSEVSTHGVDNRDPAHACHRPWDQELSDGGRGARRRVCGRLTETSADLLIFPPPVLRLRGTATHSPTKSLASLLFNSHSPCPVCSSTVIALFRNPWSALKLRHEPCSRRFVFWTARRPHHTDTTVDSRHWPALQPSPGRLASHLFCGPT